MVSANYFFYYGATVFVNVGLADSFKAQLIFGGVNFGCTFFGIWVGLLLLQFPDPLTVS
jgi:SP family sugar:H+ symporter-like MFS transporter